MIKASQPKHIEAIRTQPKVVKTDSPSNVKKVMSKEGKESKDSDEFSTELDSQVNQKFHPNPESNKEKIVKAEEILPETNLVLNSGLVILNTPEEGATANVFEATVTNEIDQLITPKKTDAPQAELKDSQIKDLLTIEKSEGELVPLADETLEVMDELVPLNLKSSKPNIKIPSLDTHQVEADSKLLNNDDFLAQRNLLARKSTTNPYGMKISSGNQEKASLDLGLKDIQVIKDGAGTEGKAINSQQFILGLQQSESKSFQTNETHAPVKVFDMNNVKTTNANELMNQITDYVVQAKAAKEPTVSVRLMHDELGMIDISIRKTGISQESIAINIGTHSLDGKNFFQQNSKDLFSHLSNAGLNVSDLKVETPGQTSKNDFDFGSQSGKNQQGSEKQFGSEQNQRRHDSERRQELWKYLNKEAA
jgi:hypothetical protein